MAKQVNRVTRLVDPLILPGMVAREASTRVQNTFWRAESPTHSKPDIGNVTHNFTQPVSDKSRTTYREFMCLDQAGAAKIARTKDDVCVSIKRMQRVSHEPVFSIPNFKSDHLVNIIDIFLEGGNTIAVVYEYMDVSLRNIMAVNRGPLQEFQIAAICKGVSNSQAEIGNTHKETDSQWPLLYS
jgi:hypothetical protein